MSYTLGWLGLIISLTVVLLGIVLPFLIPALLKGPGYKQLFLPQLLSGDFWEQSVWLVSLKPYPLLYKAVVGFGKLLCTPIFLGFLLGPWLTIQGFSRHLQRPSTIRKRSFEQLIGIQMTISSILWLLWSGIQIAQNSSLLLRKGIYLLLVAYPSLVWGPLLLALGVGLLLHSERRNQLGLLLASMAYQILIVSGAYLYFTLFVMKQAPMQFQMPPAAEITRFKWILWIGFPCAVLLGTGLLKKGERLRFHLLMTSPLWIPFFVLFFFWSLIIHTTLYFIEDITGWSWQPPKLVQIFFLSWIFLPLFPILLSIDFCISLVRFLGQTALNTFSPPDEQTISDTGEITEQPFSNTWVYTIGTVLLLTIPIWILPAFLYGGARLFIYESLLLPLLGRPQTPHTVQSTKES